ncbi:MAG: radical SAM protein [Endomicrobium sp.]|uniref:radical SAM protein n=1 Tax=Candidatus Endomicrobiellum cubanum TaxID=3242325 RepID=UPI00282F113C|nr:radical SAM protein [Endomicrobium sp.]
MTDAYNNLVTRKILESLVGIDTEIFILTKSNPVIRDIDLFKKMNNITITFSINTLDDTFRKHMEPFASSIDDRIKALKILNKNRIRTSVFLSPMFPEITNFKTIIKSLKNYSHEFWFENLNLYPYRITRILKYIDYKYSYLRDLYYEIYIAKDTSYWEQLEKEIF